MNIDITGPEVTLGSKVLNYGLITAGQSATRTVEIINKSNVAAVFKVSRVTLHQCPIIMVLITPSRAVKLTTRSPLKSSGHY